MTKKSRIDPLEKARRKLAKTQLKLHVAQEEYAQAREQGKQEVEQARLRAARGVAKAAERVEKRGQKVSDAENAVLALSGPLLPESNGQSVVAHADAMDAPGLTASTPDAVADVLEEIEEDADAKSHAENVILPNGLEPVHAPRARSEGGK